MNLCSDGHDEIAYEGSSCPACDAQIALDKANDTIDELEDQVQELKEQIQELEKEE